MAPVYRASDGEVSLLVSLDQPPSPHPGVLQRRECVAFVVTDPAALPALLPSRASLSLALPAELLRGVGVEDLTVLPLDTQSALFWPFLAFAWVCATAGDRQSGLTTYYTERLLHEMVAGVVVASLKHRPSGAPEQTYAAALSMITARLGDPDLTPAAVASEVRTSLRSLQRQFSARGTTMEGRIRQARVQHAVSLLEDPVYDSLTIDRVAQACGLSNGSSLARAFAAEGRLSPSAVRSAARRVLRTARATSHT